MSPVIFLIFVATSKNCTGVDNRLLNFTTSKRNYFKDKLSLNLLVVAMLLLEICCMMKDGRIFNLKLYPDHVKFKDDTEFSSSLDCGILISFTISFLKSYQPDCSLNLAFCITSLPIFEPMKKSPFVGIFSSERLVEIL